MRRPPFQAITQEIIRWLCRLMMTLYFRFRVHGLANYPSEDGFIICSNHQSHLDPLIVGAACPRPINYVGRETLTKFKPFGWFLQFNDMITIDREGTGLGGLKEMLRRLKCNETVSIFPEGTRTRDGNLQPIKLGFATVARRVKAPIVPMGFDGGFQAMPRSSFFIRPVRIHVVIGPPIQESEYNDLNDDEFAQLVSARIEQCLTEARHRRNRM